MQAAKKLPLYIINKENTMTDEQNVTGEVDTNTDYIAAINELKQNSVDRAKYDQLRADNKRLLDSLVNGQQLELPKVEEKPDINELRKAAFKDDQSNLEYVSNALKLRSALIKSGQPDPFLPCGEKTLPTDADVATAERVASVLQECVDIAEGDSQIFTNELMRRTVDTGPIKRK